MGCWQLGRHQAFPRPHQPLGQLGQPGWPGWWRMGTPIGWPGWWRMGTPIQPAECRSPGIAYRSPRIAYLVLAPDYAAGITYFVLAPNYATVDSLKSTSYFLEHGPRLSLT